MLRKILIGAVLFSLVFIVAACANPTSTSPQPPSGLIKAKWIEPQVAGDTVSIPVSDVENNWNIHFKLRAQGGDINFMAYIVDGEIYVRANACPPCQSVGFSLQRDILVCDTCRTTFEAKTGDGIEGACVDYPKASVPYRLLNGSVVMSADDFLTTYQNTLKPGWP